MANGNSRYIISTPRLVTNTDMNSVLILRNNSSLINAVIHEVIVSCNQNFIVRLKLDENWPEEENDIMPYNLNLNQEDESVVSGKWGDQIQTTGGKFIHTLHTLSPGSIFKGGQGIILGLNNSLSIAIKAHNGEAYVQVIFEEQRRVL